MQDNTSFDFIPKKLKFSVKEPTSVAPTPPKSTAIKFYQSVSEPNHFKVKWKTSIRNLVGLVLLHSIGYEAPFEATLNPFSESLFYMDYISPKFIFTLIAMQKFKLDQSICFTKLATSSTLNVADLIRTLIVHNESFCIDFFQLVSRGFVEAVTHVSKIVQEILSENFENCCSLIPPEPGQTSKQEKLETQNFIKNCNSIGLIALFDHLVSKHQDAISKPTITTSSKKRKYMKNGFIAHSIWKFEVINSTLQLILSGTESHSVIIPSKQISNITKLQLSDIMLIEHPFKKFDSRTFGLEIDYGEMIIAKKLQQFGDFLVDMIIFQLMDISNENNDQTLKFHNTLLKHVFSESKSKKPFESVISNMDIGIPYYTIEFANLLEELSNECNIDFKETTTDLSFGIGDWFSDNPILKWRFIYKLQQHFAKKINAFFSAPEKNQLESTLLTCMKMEKPCIISGYFINSSDCILIHAKFYTKIQVSAIKLKIGNNEFVM